MAVLTDPDGNIWSINRRWWYPGGALNLFGWVGELIGLFFLLLWPFWLLGKFCGVRWVITINREGEQVDRERVRGWKNSKLRMNEIAQQVAAGGYSAPDSEPESQPPPGPIVY